VSANDSDSSPKVLALRMVVTNLSKAVDTYAKIASEYRDNRQMPKAQRDDMRKRLLDCMLTMIGQSHLIGCQFLESLMDSHELKQVAEMLVKACEDSHDGNKKEVTELLDLMKGHRPWIQ
jgi:hypothetical protein